MRALDAHKAASKDALDTEAKNTVHSTLLDLRQQVQTKLHPFEEPENKRQRVEGASADQEVPPILATYNTVELDKAIAKWLYVAGVPFSAAQHPTFLALLRVAKKAPVTYKPPSIKKLGGPLLQEVSAVDGYGFAFSLFAKV